MGAKPNYGKGLYDQLQEVMARLDSVEKANKEETVQLKEDLSALKKRKPGITGGKPAAAQ